MLVPTPAHRRSKESQERLRLPQVLCGGDPIGNIAGAREGIGCNPDGCNRGGWWRREPAESDAEGQQRRDGGRPAEETDGWTGRRAVGRTLVLIDPSVCPSVRLSVRLPSLDQNLLHLLALSPLLIGDGKLQGVCAWLGRTEIQLLVSAGGHSVRLILEADHHCLGLG